MPSNPLFHLLFIFLRTTTLISFSLLNYKNNKLCDMKVIQWLWKNTCIFWKRFKLTSLNVVFTYHPIKCLDNGPLSLYFQFLIPWSNRCFIGFSLLYFMKYLTLITIILLLPVVCITLISSVLFLPFLLWYANDTLSQKRIEVLQFT